MKKEKVEKYGSYVSAVHVVMCYRQKLLLLSAVLYKACLY